MNYDDEYGRVIGDRPMKFARLLHPRDYAPIVDDFMDKIDNGDFSAHDSHPPILADLLQDHDDPRAELLRGSHSWQGNDYGRHHGSHYIPGGDEEKDNVEISVYTPNWTHNSKAEDARIAASVYFPSSTHQHRGISRERDITLDQARDFADRLPDEHSTALHQFIDKHFGPRE